MDQEAKCETSSELLFFDTFAHESDQESNLDLVQFANPILIDEIRIIPLGARVEADFPGGVRLGATNPSSFDVTFYINDFTKPTVCTFTDFGRFEYKQNVNIQYLPEERKPTDGLLIKGSYRTLTLAIFGVQTNVKDIIAKSETPATTPIPDPLITSQTSAVIDNEESFPFHDNGPAKDSDRSGEELVPLLDRIAQSVLKSQQIIRPNVEESIDTECLNDRAKEFSSIDKRQQHENDSLYINSRDPNVECRRRIRKPSSPSRRDSLHSLSPVRSPPSLKSPMSPQSDISMKSDVNLVAAPRSPIDDYKQKRVSSSRSLYSSRRGRITTSTYSNHSSRSPKYIQSRSPSPWHKNQINSSSQPSSPPSPLSPHYRKSRSPIKIISPTKTPIEGSLPYNKERNRRSDSSSPSSPPSHHHHHRHHTPPAKQIEIENDSYSHSISILPVNTDLLEEISPEHSLSDWAENISDDENLDDLESGEGEIEERNHLNTIVASTTTTSSEILRHSHRLQHQHQISEETEAFESISSEEEYFEEGNLEESDQLSHYSDYDLNDYTLCTFDPFHCEFTPLQSLRDPSHTDYQHLRKSKVAMIDKEDRETMLLEELKEKDGRSQKWVESMETIAKDIGYLSLENDETLQTVLNWLHDGLNFDIAMQQVMIPTKVRHLKAGIKLCIALLNSSETIVKKLIELKVSSQLMDLYFKPEMSLPIKLLLIRAFDAFCDSIAGIEHILNEQQLVDPNNSEVKLTIYQRLLTNLLNKPPSRVTIALEALFNKIHFYELLQQFNSTVQSSQFDHLKLSSCIRKIGSTFASARKLLTQKIRCLPVTCFFEIKDPKCDCYLSIYNWFQYTQFLDNLIKLLKNPNHESLASDIHQLINIMLSEQSFARFLLNSSNCSKTNELTSLLVQQSTDSYYQNYYAADRLSYMLQATQLVDSLVATTLVNSFDIKICYDDPEICLILFRLYGLILSSVGRECVIKTISSSNNFKAFLPFLTSTGVKSIDHKLYKSVCSAYATEFCLLLVQSSDEEIINILTNYGSTFISLSKNDQLPKLASLTNWLKPLETLKTFDYSEVTFKELMKIVKNCAESANKLKENEIFILPPQLITAMRILKKLCIEPEIDVNNIANKPVKELKYYYATIQVFEHDGLSTILTLQQKLAETYLRPSHQSSALVGDQGAFMMGFVQPSVKLVKEMLTKLIAARGKDFRDTSPIPVMLKLYSLMYIFPRSSYVYQTSREVIREIVDVLMLYTQLTLTPSESDSEALAKGVWTKMISEVLKYTFSMPMTFIHGLSLLSELLPLPLPFQTLSPLNDDEVNKLINIRKLWSAHLLGLNIELEKLIFNFVLCSSPIIQQLLRRVCVQISDLSSPASTMMVRLVLEALLDSLPSDKSPELTSSLLYVLNLLSYLSTHPPFKMAFIHTMHIGSKLDEKYFTIVGRLLKLLRKETTKPIEVKINQQIFAFLQSLCDSDIYLNSRDSSISSLQILSNSLPPKESLKLIISALLHFLNSLVSHSSPPASPTLSESTPSLLNSDSFLPILRILNLLCEHDHGFIPLKQGIFDEAPNFIKTIIMRIASSINSRFKIDDLKRLICAVLDFIKAFMFENDKRRTNKLNCKEIAFLLDWPGKENNLSDKAASPTLTLTPTSTPTPAPTPPLQPPTTTTTTTTVEENEVIDKEDSLSEKNVICELEDEVEQKSTNDQLNISSKSVNNDHAILILRDYLSDDIMDEGVISCMRLTVKNLLDILSQPSDESASEIVNIELPTIEPLPLQFSKREVFIVTNNIDSEKLNTNFWLSVPTFDDHLHDHDHLHHQHPNNTSPDPTEDKLHINLIELCTKYLSSDFNLQKALVDWCKTQESNDVANPSSKPSTESTVNPIKRNLDFFLPNRDSKSFANVKKSFVAPLRGRGFGRTGSLMHSSRANDPFRSRPPNTSRPPSMHVDDFVALEQSGTNCNSFETPNNKRLKLDYNLKGRPGGSSGNNSNGSNLGLVHNSSSSRSFGASTTVSSRSSPSYHYDLYSNRRSSNSVSHQRQHPSPSRNNISSNSGRTSLSRYSRDSYSPPGSRSTRSGSLGPVSSSQHWSKSNSTSRRDSRESRDSRDSRSVRASNNR